MSKSHSGISKRSIIKILDRGCGKIHFVGIGGVGMYSLARLSLLRGFEVSGSDRDESEHTRMLEACGCEIKIGHSAENARGASLVVYTLAASESNPELLYAGENNIPSVSRAEYLGALMENYKIKIGVSGSHGKSTSSAMLDGIFTKAGFLPTTVIGAALSDTGEPVRIGEGRVFIYEACEYKDSFLRFSPTVALFTNLELDHVDYFKGLDEIKSSFLCAINSAKTAVVNIDDENLRSLIPLAKAQVITFGEGDDADYKISVITESNGFYSIKIRHGMYDTGKISLSVAGRHNALNAAGAAVCAISLGVDSRFAKLALSEFSGIERRLEKIGNLNGGDVYYDYAHHPTEIECTVRTLKEISSLPITVIFKPHTYSRTAGFMHRFRDALSYADRVLLCEISAVREESIPGVTSQALAEMIGERARVIDENNICSELSTLPVSNLIIMGAANLDTVKKELENECKKFKDGIS